LILVTVGTHNRGFDRLVKAMDELAAALDEPVIMQRGSSAYEPRHAEHFQWTTGQQIERLVEEARVVVTHAAAGSILVALLHDRPLVVVPRLRRFDECIDDHQQQLAAALHAAGKAVLAEELSAAALRTALDQAARRSARHDGAGRLVQALRQQLQPI
jgi:UDP-N-acetylglucosamine transferase subunit ALG13